MSLNSASSTGQGPCKVTAVIVTYNRLSMLKTVIKHTLAQNFSSVVVVNNASPDGTRGWLAGQTDPRLHILNETINLGGAGGFARGMDYAARQTDCEWIVCFDDDAWPQPGALGQFQSLSLSSETGGVAAAVYFPDDTVCDMNRPGLSPFRKIGSIIRLIRDRKKTFAIDLAAYEKDELQPVDYASFVGFFVRAGLVRGSLGLPQKDLFVYADDTLYTWKLRSLGWKIKFAPGIRFYHDCSTTVDFSRNHWKMYYIIRNRIIFYRKISGILFFPFSMLLVFGVFRLYLKNRNIRNVRRLVLTAMWDGFLQNTERNHESVVSISEIS
ncbi:MULTISPECIES: glycosyltransferase [Asaia]|uniref:glycosyltransferase n=1 Tax=Asaia TaxID=91914 RepID=UPI002FC2EE12